jgi:SRSO17 transposase
VTANEKQLRGVAKRFAKFHNEFARFFQTKTRDSSEIAGQYLNGLVQAPKKNMERMEEKVPESNEQALQHFVTNSPWDEKAVLKQVAIEGNKLLGGTEDSCLLIDETGFVKKGKNSVGVIRQYCGRTGKVDNCQVAVFAALVSGDKSLPIDFRLYLPKEWTDDIPRCLKAGIPAEKIQFKTKCQQAIEMVKATKENGVKFNWVGVDGGYGKDPGFLGDLFALDLTFVADVHKNQLIYFANPNEEAKAQQQTVEKWVNQQIEKSWQTITVRECTKGNLVFDYLHAHVWIKVTHEKNYRQVRLIVRRNHEGQDDLKFSVSNAPDPITLERLAYMQGQRFWIERAFEDSKGSLGMSDYQLRKWRGWHHHMALTLLAHLFLLRERLQNAEAYPLLSCQDVVSMLAFYLPKRDVTEEEIFRQLQARHRKRQDEIDRAKKR